MQTFRQKTRADSSNAVKAQAVKSRENILLAMVVFQPCVTARATAAIFVLHWGAGDYF